jgi:hypothetical protein
VQDFAIGMSPEFEKGREDFVARQVTIIQYQSPCFMTLANARHLFQPLQKEYAQTRIFERET